MPFGPFGIGIAVAAEHLGSIWARNADKGGPLHPDKTATPELFKAARAEPSGQAGLQRSLEEQEELGSCRA